MGGTGSGNSGVRGRGSLWEMGERIMASGIPMVAQTGKNRKKLLKHFIIFAAIVKHKVRDVQNHCRRVPVQT